MIPVDIVANMTIAISWFTANNYNSYKQYIHPKIFILIILFRLSTPIIYNCCTGTNNKTCLSLEDFCLYFIFIFILNIIYLVKTIITEQKAIGFENYSIIEPSIILTMNRYSCTNIYRLNGNISRYPSHTEFRFEPYFRNLSSIFAGWCWSMPRSEMSMAARSRQVFEKVIAAAERSR